MMETFYICTVFTKNKIKLNFRIFYNVLKGCVQGVGGGGGYAYQNKISIFKSLKIGIFVRYAWPP